MPAIRGVDLQRELADNPPAGLSRAGARLREQAIELMLAEELVEASYSCEIVPLDRPPPSAAERDGAAAGTLHCGGTTLHAPRLLPASGQLTALGCGVCTLGARLGERAGALFAERRAALAVALDELGSEMLFALGRRIQDRMLSECYRKRLGMGAELHAGDPGLGLEAHAAVLQLSRAERIGVGLHRGGLLTPLKSSSVVFAVGRDLPQVSWSRCESCPSRARCNFGRRPPAALHA